MVVRSRSIWVTSISQEMETTQAEGDASGLLLSEDEHQSCLTLNLTFVNLMTVRPLYTSEGDWVHAPLLWIGGDKV